MQFQIVFTRPAEADLSYYKVYEQRTILEAIKLHLETEPLV
jgi:hypothetical protein